MTNIFGISLSSHSAVRNGNISSLCVLQPPPQNQGIQLFQSGAHFLLCFCLWNSEAKLAEEKWIHE